MNPKSPSTWGCGLKHLIYHYLSHQQHVTLYVRVWIETWKRLLFSISKNCHPLREGVDWNSVNIIPCKWILRHPLREGVDWNTPCAISEAVKFCHPLREGVDWNNVRLEDFDNAQGHPLREGVDWNYLWLFIFTIIYKSPSTWGCGLKLKTKSSKLRHMLSPSTWGCGLKQRWLHDFSAGGSHPLREGVDWNNENLLLKNTFVVTLYVRVWIETAGWCSVSLRHTVTLYVRVWIETAGLRLLLRRNKVTLYVRVWIETNRHTELWT